MHLPASADVVVIGGGILGISAALHLKRLGAGHVVLVERAPTLASQTTYAGAGFVANWNGDSEPEQALEHYGLDFYRTLAASHDIGSKNVGLLFVATTEATAEAQRDAHARKLARRGADEVALLTPQQVADAAPIVVPSRVCGGLLHRSALRVSAPAAARALGRALADAGAAICTGVEVRGIALEAGHVAGVHTTHGTIATRRVVNAAGAWLGQVAGMAGVRLPLVPLQASRFATEPLPELPADMPMLLFPDYHGLYIREDGGGLLIGSEEIVVHPPSLMRTFAGALGFDTPSAAHEAAPETQALPSNTHRYHAMLARDFAHTIPALGHLAIRDVRNGLPTRTPDLRHLLGQCRSAPGLYIVGADCEIGVTHGPGLGKLVAELVLHDRTSVDISAYRLDRFAA